MRGKDRYADLADKGVGIQERSGGVDGDQGERRNVPREWDVPAGRDAVRVRYGRILQVPGETYWEKP